MMNTRYAEKRRRAAAAPRLRRNVREIERDNVLSARRVLQRSGPSWKAEQHAGQAVPVISQRSVASP